MTMSFDKAIKYGKEHRKPYRGGKAIDPSCRNHGGCPWCEENRQIQQIKAKLLAQEKIREYLEDEMEQEDAGES